MRTYHRSDNAGRFGSTAEVPEGQNAPARRSSKLRVTRGDFGEVGIAISSFAPDVIKCCPTLFDQFGGKTRQVGGQVLDGTGRAISELTVTADRLGFRRAQANISGRSLAEPGRHTQHWPGLVHARAHRAGPQLAGGAGIV